MPKLMDEMQTHAIAGSNYGFSAVKIGEHVAAEQTLGLVIVDVSGSVWSYKDQIEAALKEIVKACRRNPRADNMMLRVVFFNGDVDEIHGFKLLADCNEGDYTNTVQPGGGTALFDACYNALKATTGFADQLDAKDIDCNAAVFVLTDGDDNSSTTSRKMVKEAMGEAVKSETLESITSVLIGVNTAGGLADYLQKFKTEAGFSQFVAIEDATESELAKLGDFISRSISSQSLSLGTGGPSKSLTF